MPKKLPIGITVPRTPYRFNRRLNRNTSQEVTQNIVNIQQRRMANDNNLNEKRSFSQVAVASAPARRGVNLRQKTYDKGAHNEALFFPNSRIPNFSKNKAPPLEAYPTPNMQIQHCEPSTSSGLYTSNSAPAKSAYQTNVNSQYNPIENIFNTFRELSETDKNTFRNLLLEYFKKDLPSMMIDQDMSSP